MRTLVCGVDVGSGAVKSALLSFEDGEVRIVGLREDRYRKRPLDVVIRDNYQQLLAGAQVEASEIAYVASTGEGEMVPWRTGHFYSMTTHARGAIHLDPSTRAVLDLGALHARAIRIDERGKVLQYRMTSQCASGSGQFLENIARYLGVSLDEVGPLSMQSTKPETASSICAVLAETDVINMVSRGIRTPDILKGIHLSIAGRLVKLLRAIGAQEVVMVTGGLSHDEGLLRTIEEQIQEQGLPLRVVTHPRAVFAGAIGAALWGRFRLEKLREAGLAEEILGSGDRAQQTR
jgi:benzoyl-CoA reductase subunit D